jgi:DNA primase
MRIPPQKVDEIYQAIDIVEVVSDYLPLKKKGQNYWALSPFVNEKTPSFAVSPAKNIYKDFSSGKGGNAVNFLMEMEGYTYVEALQHIARKYGIEIEEEAEDPEEAAARDERQSLMIVNTFAAEFFHQQLLESGEGRKIGLSYFKERGILESTIKAFQLGYAPDSWDTLAKEAEKKQFNAGFLEELGLCFRSDKTGNLIDRFRGRVMFPITSPIGKVVGFGGRILGDHKKEAKYINSPESRIYHKAQVLFGLSVARQHIRNEDLCILTEGYMDTIALYQGGIRNVVASSGTALSPEQIRLIRRFSRNVLIIYDGDAAGTKAAIRAIDLLLSADMSPQVLLLPDKHDPDSFIKEKGASGFREYMQKEASNFLEFRLRLLESEGKAADPDRQAEWIRELAGTIARISDRIRQELYVREMAERMGISESLMSHAVHDAMVALQKETRQEAKREARLEGAEVKELKSFEQLELAQQERELLRLVVNYYDRSFPEDPNDEQTEEVSLTGFMVAELADLTFENQIFEELKNDIFQAWEQNTAFDINRYLNHEDQAICNLVSELLTIPYNLSENWRKHDYALIEYDGDLGRSAKSSVFHYKLRRVEKMLRENQARLRDAAPEKQEELLRVNIYLKNLHVELFRQLGIEGAARTSGN